MHVARMMETKAAYRVLFGKLEERDHVEDPGVYGRIIMRWIFRNLDVGVRTGLIWLRTGTGGLFWKHYNGPWCRITCGELLD